MDNESRNEQLTCLAKIDRGTCMFDRANLEQTDSAFGNQQAIRIVNAQAQSESTGEGEGENSRYRLPRGSTEKGAEFPYAAFEVISHVSCVVLQLWCP